MFPICFPREPVKDLLLLIQCCYRRKRALCCATDSVELRLTLIQSSKPRYNIILNRVVLLDSSKCSKLVSRESQWRSSLVDPVSQWRSSLVDPVLLQEETEVPGENLLCSVESNWRDSSRMLRWNYNQTTAYCKNRTSGHRVVRHLH